MKKEDLLLIILALFLLFAMILTYVFREERSMYGYGAYRPIELHERQIEAPKEPIDEVWSLKRIVVPG